MKTLKYFLVVAGLLAAVTVSTFAQTNDAVQLSPDQVAKVAQSVSDLSPMLPAKYQGLVNAGIGLLGVLAIVGRIIVGWRTGGLGGVISGLFKGTNVPKPVAAEPEPTQRRYGLTLPPVKMLILLLLPALLLTGCSGTTQVVNFSKGTGLNAHIPIGYNGANLLEFNLKVGQFYSATAVQPVSSNTLYAPALAFASSTDGTVTAPQIGGTNIAHVTGGDKFTASIGAASGSISNLVGNTQSTGR